MDVFNWSMPFISEKVAEMLLVLLNLCDDEEAEKNEHKDIINKEEDEKKRQLLRANVKSVSKMRMFSLLRQEQETIMMIKSFSPSRKITQGLLTEGKDALKKALGDFAQAHKMDLINEKRPPMLDRVNSRGELFRINSKGDSFRSNSYADLKPLNRPQETIKITECSD